MSFCTSSEEKTEPRSNKRTKVTANGVRLKGAFGFSLFRQSNRYSFCDDLNSVSASSGFELAPACRAMSCRSHPTKRKRNTAYFCALTSCDLPDSSPGRIIDITLDLEGVFTSPGPRFKGESAGLASTVVGLANQRKIKTQTTSLTDDEITIVIDDGCAHDEIGNVGYDLLPPAC